MDARAVRRACIVLLAAEGVGNHEIARRLEISRNQAIEWRKRFVQGDLRRSAAQRPQAAHRRRRDRRVTTQTLPQAAMHWSTRTLAVKLGVSDTTVLKVWRANGLKPHLVETFKRMSWFKK